MRKDAALNGNEEAMQEIAAALAPWKLKVLDQEGIASALPFDPMQPVLSQVDGSVVEHCRTFLHRMFKELLVPLMMKGEDSETIVVKFCKTMIAFFESSLPEDAEDEVEETICASLQAWRVVECLWCPGKLDTDAGEELNGILDAKKTSPLYCLRTVFMSETTAYPKLVRNFQTAQPYVKKYAPKIRDLLRKCKEDQDALATTSWLKAALDDMCLFRSNLRAGAADEVCQAIFAKVEQVFAFAATDECKLLHTAAVQQILAALSMAEVLFPRLGNCSHILNTLKDQVRQADCGQKLDELQAAIANYFGNSTKDMVVYDGIAKIADERQGLVVVDSVCLDECFKLVVVLFTLQGEASSEESSVYLGLVKSILALLGETTQRYRGEVELKWWETVRKLSDTSACLFPLGCDCAKSLHDDKEFRKMKVLLVGLTVSQDLMKELIVMIKDGRLDPGMKTHSLVKTQVETAQGEYLVALTTSANLRLEDLLRIAGGMSDGSSWLAGFDVHLSTWDGFREHAENTL